MADHPNVGRMKEGYAAFASGDLTALKDLFDDGIKWHVPGDNPLAGDYDGRDAVFEFFGRIAQETGGSFKLDVHDVLANDEHGVGLVQASAERNGKKIDQKNVHVYHLKDGKVTEFWGFAEDDKAVDDFWS